ncbi:hypothetical protein ScPMuIL_003406 [Solemya velum]
MNPSYCQEILVGSNTKTERRIKDLEELCKTLQLKYHVIEERLDAIGKHEVEPTQSAKQDWELQQGVEFSGLVINHNDSRIASDCFDIYGLGYRDNGVYLVRLGNTDVRIKCNLKETPRNWNMDNRLEHLKGWVVVQNRRTASDFNRSWEKYKRGFGDLESDFWLGNEIVYQLVKKSTGSVYLFVRFYGYDYYYYYRYLAREVEMENEKALYKIRVSNWSYETTIQKLFLPALKTQFNFSTSDNFDQKDPRCPVADSGWWRPDYPNCMEYTKNPNTPYSLSVNVSSTGDGIWGFQHDELYIIGSEMLMFVNTTKNIQ